MLRTKLGSSETALSALMQALELSHTGFSQSSLPKGFFISNEWGSGQFHSLQKQEMYTWACGRFVSRNKICIKSRKSSVNVKIS